jgi:hypothetical protein
LISRYCCILFPPYAGRTDSKWRRRFCALKGSNLFILRTAASPKPLAVLNLDGAEISASKTPLYPADNSDGGTADDSDVLWVLRVVVLEDVDRRSSRGSRGSSGYVKYKLATHTQELQVRASNGIHWCSTDGSMARCTAHRHTWVLIGVVAYKQKLGSCSSSLQAPLM